MGYVYTLISINKLKTWLNYTYDTLSNHIKKSHIWFFIDTVYRSGHNTPKGKCHRHKYSEPCRDIEIYLDTTQVSDT